MRFYNETSKEMPIGRVLGIGTITLPITAMVSHEFGESTLS